jgi:valyl-tRNA synthetase
MELDKTYDPKPVEDKWYQYWLEHKFFAARPNPDKGTVLHRDPPPNVTGRAAHGAHAQQYDPGRAHAEGPHGRQGSLLGAGTDHASIATEAKVVAMLREKGIEKRSLSREEFLKHAWEVDRKVRRHHPRTTQEAGRLLRLGPHAVHDGSPPFPTP